MSAAPGKSGPPRVASLQRLGPDCQPLLGSSPPPAKPLLCCCWGFPHFPPGEEQFANAGMEYKQKVMDSAVTKQPEAALMEGRTIPHSICPSPLAPIYKHKFPLDDQVSRVSSSIFFYSALQALCFMFPIAPPEINQSKTCSRSLGRWRRPSTLLAVPRMNSCAVLVKRYVLAGLSSSEGKTIIVVFCLCFLSFFTFPPRWLVFGFPGFTPPY